MAEHTDRIIITDGSEFWEVDLTVREQTLLKYFSELLQAKLIDDNFLTGEVNIKKTIDVLGKEIIGLTNKIVIARASSRKEDMKQ